MRNNVTLFFLNMMPCLQLQLARSKKQVQKHLWIFRRLMIYMFLLPHVLNNTFRTPVLFIVCCLSRKCFAQLHHQCVTTPQVDSLTNMTCIHTMLRSWRSFGTPYPTKIANKTGHIQNLRVPLLSHHLREIPVEVTGGRVVSH